MRHLDRLVEPVRVRAVSRPVVGFGVVLGGVALALMADVTVQNLQGEAGLPATRVAILLSCVVSNLLVAWVRPVLPLHERLSVRRTWVDRLILGAAAALLLIVTVLLLAGGPGARYPLTCLAGFVGLGLGWGALAPGLGVVVPWLYAISGLAFGYRTGVGGPAHLRPWAWMIGDGGVWWPQVTLFAAGLALFVWREPRHSSATAP